MALPATDPASRLIALIARAEPVMQNALLSAITATKKAVVLDSIVELIAAGRFEAAIEVAVKAGSIAVGDTYTAIYTMAGSEGAAALSEILEVGISFNQVNLRAVAQMQAERLRLITEFTSAQREATRTALTDGIQRGLNPRDQARAIRDSIGLTNRQQRAVINYRHLLEDGSSEALGRQLRDKRFDRTVRRAISSGKPLTPEQVDRMVGRYSERYVKYRSEVIARTESLRAVHAGNNEAYEQAIEQGELSKDQIMRTWIAAGDERVRDTHEASHGLEARMGETFPVGSGELMYPGDPSGPAQETIQCRCSLSSRMVKLTAAETLV